MDEIRSLFSKKEKAPEASVAEKAETETKMAEETSTEAAAPADAAAAPADNAAAKWDELVARVDDIAKRLAALEGAGMSAELTEQKTAMSKIADGVIALSAEIDALKVIPQGEIAGKEKKTVVSNDKSDKPMTKTAEVLAWRIKNGYSKPSTMMGARAN